MQNAKKVSTKYSTFTSILVLALTSVIAQPNLYFQNNPVWQVSSSCAVPAPCIQEESKNYFLNGDTTINSYTFKKVYKKGQGFYNWMAPPPIGCTGSYWFIDTIPTYFLRSIGKQIYLRQPSDTSEYLLYDFDLSIGDTLPITFNNPQNNIYVSGIDSVFTPSGFCKIFNLTGSNSAQFLIEGIGSSNGLIEPISVVLECGYFLSCYSLNDTSYYPALGPTCNLSIGINESGDKLIASFSPNPFSFQTTLQVDNYLENAVLIVENRLGQTVAYSKNISGRTIIFNRENLTCGLYIAKLIQDNKVIYTSKLIITD